MPLTQVSIVRRALNSHSFDEVGLNEREKVKCFSVPRRVRDFFARIRFNFPATFSLTFFVAFRFTVESRIQVRQIQGNEEQVYDKG